MFSKTSVAVLAGIALTGSLLARPTVVAAPASGRAAAWGYNAYGQLGNNTTTDSAVPVAVNTAGPLAGRTVTAITAGGDHSCAVADGRAYCWGYNNVGQLGNNTTTNSAVPVAVNTAGPLAGRTVTAITAGDSHTCAVAEGRASCWGKNDFGQLGNNSTTNSAVPVPVDTAGVLAVKTVTAITASAYSSFAVAEGKAFCWGSNVYGQLGNNSTTNASVPVPVDTAGVLAGKTVTAITAGGFHAAVLPATVPQPPTAVSGIAGDAKVTVSWAAPADDGGSPITECVATAVPGGATCTTADTSCVVPGLANGTAYTFTVTARNAIGTSAPSAPSVPVTHAASVTLLAVAPGKVSGLKTVVRKGKVKITWKPVPASSSYRVRISTPGGKKYKAWKTTSKTTFKATVKKGKKYRFQIAAVGTGGNRPTTTIKFKGK